MREQAPQLSNDYLAGEWCYSHYTAGNERKDQRINYVFKADGTLLYQNNPTTAVTKEGSYAVTDDTVKILPTFMAFNLRPKTASPDGFVLTGMGDHFFNRGPCP